jgi:hypothetical protein
MRLGYNSIDKLDFLKGYPKTHSDVFKPGNIKNGFLAAGIVPFNPEMVLIGFMFALINPLPAPRPPPPHDSRESIFKFYTCNTS